MDTPDASSVHPSVTDGALGDAALAAALEPWLPQQRWFSAKGTAITGVRVLSRETLAASPDLRVDHVLVSVGLEGAPEQIYQIPLGIRDSVGHDLEAWVVPGFDGVVVYDGLRDPEVISVYADLFATGGSGDVRFLAVPGSDMRTGLRGRVLGAEQSNTSVILGDALLLKIFRRVTVGINPDVELHRALGEADCRYVAPLQGWMEIDIDGVPTTLSMAQDFVAGSAEGWTTALETVTRVLASGDVESADFAPDSRELGKAVAEVHADLARVLGTSTTPAAQTVTAIGDRVESAVSVVPELADHLERIRALIGTAADSGDAVAQRIHGDLHLGQVLRTDSGWVLIDFEGEPSKSFEDRRTPDSALRDVAGMLRSFDYAARSQVVDIADPDARAAAEPVARQWVERNARAFLEGYAEVAGVDPRDHPALLQAYELDKAVYEAVYEARNRPGWLTIPMHAIERLTTR